MPKIWEVDFATFSGGTDIVLDNIGNQHLVNPSNILQVPVVPGMTFRPGIQFIQNGTVSNYLLNAPANSNALWSGNYQRRSFVCWFYNSGGWFPEEGTIWGEYSGGSSGHGWRYGSSGNGIKFTDGSGFVISYPFDFLGSVGWKFMVANIDRGAGNYQVFGKSSSGTPVDFTSAVTNKPPGTTPPFQTRIGDTDSGRESSMYLGYMATYDHLLSVAEIDGLFNTFLIDSQAGGASVATLTGVVVDEDFNTASGVDVLVYDNDNDVIVSREVSASGGNYSVDIPFFGNYTVMASRPPLKGSVAEPFSVPSSGTIIFLND